MRIRGDRDELILALELKSDNVESVVKDLPQFVSSSAETVSQKPFLNGLEIKNYSSQSHIGDCGR